MSRLGPDTSEMVEALRILAEAESFSADPEGLADCARALGALGQTILGEEPERSGRNLLWRRPGERPLLLLGHYDTVWPRGTLEGFPFSVAEGVARGPGVFDMKAGIVQGLYALRSVEGPVTLLVTSDEEIGAPASRDLIEEEARRSRAALVLEPSANGGAVKVARKGISQWSVEVEGRAAHSGLEPEKGVNAVEELAHQIETIRSLASADAGTSVSVTMAGGGTAENVVPESAWCRVNARAWTRDETERLETAMGGLEPRAPGARVTVRDGGSRPPMERAAAEPLYRRLLALGYDVAAAEVGGGSDGNFTAALGVPTLDGLGAVGGGAHAREEHVLVEEMPGRTEMLARLIEDLVHHG